MRIKMRRHRQALSTDEIAAILNNATNGILALQGDEDYPYAVPMSFAYDGRDIYLHSSVEGHKIDCIRQNPKVSFCVVSEDRIVPEEFTTYFRSVIAFCTAQVISDRSEKIYGLKLLADKYSPGFDSAAEIEKGLPHTTVIRLSVDALTGKQAIELLSRQKP